MENNVVKDRIFQHNRWKRTFLWRLRKTRFRKRLYSSAFFFEEILKESPIPKKRLEELAREPKVKLEHFISRNGNVTAYELLVLCSIVAERMLKCLLEIGTFDGNTTLQLALNASTDATIHTIDLPRGIETTTEPVLTSDLQFIRDEKKHERKCRDLPNVIQHEGDSTSYDFSKFGTPQFAFIDGGHSYECVKCDTENVLKILPEEGIVFWHDFTPLFGGVFQFLSELSKHLPLTHVEGTNLVFYTKER